MACNGCKNITTEIYACDRCKLGLCKTCAGLTSSEVRVMQLKERVMVFNCRKCRSLDMITLLQSTINDKEKIILSMEGNIKYLQEKIEGLEAKPGASPLMQTISYSQVAKQDSGKQNVSVNIPSLIIKPKRQQDLAKTKTDMTMNINPTELKVAIKGIRHTSNGNVIVKCQNKRDLEILQREALSKLPDYEIKTTRMMKPRFKITGYEGELDREQLEKSIREQNQFIEETDELGVTYIKQSNKNNVCIIYGECSSTLFHKFMAAKRIFIGWERCSIYEDVSIARCFKCQQHYHKSGTCPNGLVCEYCGETHNVRDCPKVHKKCVNCLNANTRYKTNHKIDHSANDPLCPSYQYLVNVLRSKIDYGYGA